MAPASLPQRVLLVVAAPAAHVGDAILGLGLGQRVVRRRAGPCGQGDAERQSAGEKSASRFHVDVSRWLRFESAAAAAALCATPTPRGTKSRRTGSLKDSVAANC